MSIEPKNTADNSDQHSGGFPVVEGNRTLKIPEMASKRHRAALAAGICGIIILVAAVATVAGLMSKSFQNDASGDPSDAFDFNDIAPEVDDDGSSTIRGVPTASPSKRPLQVTGSPTATPTTGSPTGFPTGAPTTMPSFGPSAIPSDEPTSAPTAVATPSPTALPTMPSPQPTMMPNTRAPVTPVNYTSPTLLTFCVIADVPYFDDEKAQLPLQIRDQMEDCEFLVHLGDIMRGDIPCDNNQYIDVKDIMLESEVPTFIVPGDNEWNDCGSNEMVEIAWGKWDTHFMHMEDNWNHSIPVVRSLDYTENFYFIQKRTLIVGLNIVGGRVHDPDEWLVRHTAEAEWVKEIVEMNVPLNADGVIIMAHAKPTENHVKFFNPLRRLIRDDLGNDVPFLYLHGDGHSWVYTPGFMNQPNFLKVQHEGGVRHPILKVLADPSGQGPQVTSAFQFDRQMYLQ